MAVGDMLRSPAWKNVAYPVTQEFGVMGADPSLYPAEYTEPLGYPAGYHIGLDVGVPKGTKLYALNPGTVMQASGSYPENPGNPISLYFRPKPVWIETENNPETPDDEEGFIEIWGHMWDNAVQGGERVQPGQLLGVSGEQTYQGTMTPDNTGPHIHFELRMPTSEGQYKAVNPTRWLQRSGVPTGESDDGPDGAPDNGTGADNGDDAVSPSGPSSLSLIGEYAQRGILVLVGILILGIGVWFVLR